MTDRTEILDAAIMAAEQASKSAIGWPDETSITEVDRTYARALIAHIADHMSRHITSPMVWMGYSIALDDLREIAGVVED